MVNTVCVRRLLTAFAKQVSNSRKLPYLLALETVLLNSLCVFLETIALIILPGTANYNHSKTIRTYFRFYKIQRPFFLSFSGTGTT